MTNQRKYEDIPEWARLDVAIEIISELLSEKRRIVAESKEKGESKDILESHQKELDMLIEEREKMYFGDKDVLKKIIDEYGPEVRKFFSGDSKI